MLTKENQKEFDKALDTLEAVLEESTEVPRKPYEKEIWTIEHMLIMELLNKKKKKRAKKVLQNTEKRERDPNAQQTFTR